MAFGYINVPGITKSQLAEALKSKTDITESGKIQDTQLPDHLVNVSQESETVAEAQIKTLKDYTTKEPLAVRTTVAAVEGLQTELDSKAAAGQQGIDELAAKLSQHEKRTDNPHQVTAQQAGADPKGTGDAVKKELEEKLQQLQTTLQGSIGELQSTVLPTVQSALEKHTSNKQNPHEVTPQQIGAAALAHQHSAADINDGILPAARGGTGLGKSPKIQVNLGVATEADVFQASVKPGVSGTLGVANGGTGLTAAPSLQVNLASTSADSVMKAQPRPGVTGLLPVTSGGTGSSTADAARNALGAAASGHKHDAGDITSGTLSAARGGTGRTDGTAAKALKADALSAGAGSDQVPVYIKSDGKAASVHIPNAGHHFGGVCVVGNDGVTEVGRYIDFHRTDATKADYDTRLEVIATAGDGGIGPLITLPNRNGNLALGSGTDGSIRMSDPNIITGVLPVKNGGTGYDSLTGTDYTTYRVREISIQGSTPSSISNGRVVLVYV